MRNQWFAIRNFKTKILIDNRYQLCASGSEIYQDEFIWYDKKLQIFSINTFNTVLLAMQEFFNNAKSPNFWDNN